MRDGKWGVISRTGKIIQDFKLDNRPDFLHGNNIGFAKVGDKWGAITTKGEWAIKPKFDYLGYSRHEFLNRGSNIIARIGGMCGVIDNKGAFVHGPWPKKWVGTYQDGIAAALVDHHWGLLDRSGRFVLQPVYSSISAERGMHGFFLVEMYSSTDGHKKGVVNLRGETVVPPEFKWVKYYDGPTPYFVVHGTKCGVVGADGAVLIDVMYEDIVGPYGEKRTIPFSEELFAVKKDGKYGYLDSLGNFVVPPRYDNARPFGPHAAVILTERQDTTLEGAAEGTATRHYYGLVAKDGAELLPARFYHITPVYPEQTIYLVRESREGKHGYFHVSGHWIWRPTE